MTGYWYELLSTRASFCTGVTSTFSVVFTPKTPVVSMFRNTTTFV